MALPSTPMRGAEPAPFTPRLTGRGNGLRLGETLSEAPATETDRRASEALRSTLDRAGLVETRDGLAARERVVSELEGVCKAWVADLAKMKAEQVRASDVSMTVNGGKLDGMDDRDGGGCRLFTFGSFRLGVHAPDSDVDVLLVAPVHVKRNDFFTDFVQRLSQHEGVAELLSIPEAYTPVIKFELHGVAVDLLFVSLWRTRLPSDFSPLAPDALAHLDEQGVRSLNGARNAEMIHALVDDLEAFRVALRALKHWAKRRGIYGNVFGFLGGINFAILAAFVCQRCPKAPPSTILATFFELFDAWQWPNPVMLTPLADSPTFGAELLVAASPGTRAAAAVAQAAQHVVWNPRINPQDAAQLMPIITPAYPAMNSAYNVGEAQLRRVKAEVRRGFRITSCLRDCPPERAGDCEGVWEKLFAHSDFFSRYEHYLQVRVSACSKEALKPWLAWVESKLRYLIIACDSPPTTKAHPYASLLPEAPSNPLALHFFIGLTFQEGTPNVDLTPAVADFITKVNQWGRRTLDMELMIFHRLKDTLPAFVHAPQGAAPASPRRAREAAAPRHRAPGVASALAQHDGEAIGGTMVGAALSAFAEESGGDAADGKSEGAESARAEGGDGEEAPPVGGTRGRAAEDAPEAPPGAAPGAAPAAAPAAYAVIEEARPQILMKEGAGVAGVNENAENAATDAAPKGDAPPAKPSFSYADALRGRRD